MSCVGVDDGDDERAEIRLVQNPDGDWTARHLQVEIVWVQPLVGRRLLEFVGHSHE